MMKKAIVQRYVIDGHLDYAIKEIMRAYHENSRESENLILLLQQYNLAIRNFRSGSISFQQMTRIVSRITSALLTEYINNSRVIENDNGVATFMIDKNAAVVDNSFLFNINRHALLIFHRPIIALLCIAILFLAIMIIIAINKCGS